MILDKLMEKKDLIAYINFRIDRLRRMIKNVNRLDEGLRNNFIMRTKGKIIELKRLKNVLNNNNLKELSKTYYQKKRKNKISLSAIINKLIQEGFFDKTKFFGELMDKLNKMGCYYPRTTVYALIIRDFVRTDTLERIGKKGQYKFIFNKKLKEVVE